MGDCGHIIGSDILSFDKEADLLEKWAEFVRAVDPDIVTGYNVMNFDWPYLILRAQTLSIHTFPYLGRMKYQKTQAKDTRFTSKAYGSRDNKDITLDGRVQLDMLQVIQRDHKLRSYTLNSVSAHFLGNFVS